MWTQAVQQPEAGHARLSLLSLGTGGLGMAQGAVTAEALEEMGPGSCCPVARKGRKLPDTSVLLAHVVAELSAAPATAPSSCLEPRFL